MEDIYFIFDFDSTFIKSESFEDLAQIALKSHPEYNSRLIRIKQLTDMAMNGEMPFDKSLSERLSLTGISEEHIAKCIQVLKRKITPSFLKNKAFFREKSKQILILSSGFKELISPVVADFGLTEEQIFANTFKFDKTGQVVGIDLSNPLSGNGGKVKIIRKLKLKGEVYVIGDGYTDYELKKTGLADYFYAFTENINRPFVVSQADHVLPNLDELLFKFKLPASVSYPKNRIKVLLLESIHEDAASLFRKEGYEIQTYAAALEEAELIERISEVSILGIRSKTQVTEKVLTHAKKLISIGAFCIGTNQINIQSCNERGISVFNAPYSNTRSVVELAIAEMIMLLRRIPDKNNGLHQGKWDKSAKGAREIRGKKLGIIGYGNIGTQLSVIAESLGMEVYFFDVVDKLALGNARKCSSLIEVLKICDVVSVHVDGRKENTTLIGKKELRAMKKGAVLLNLSRGHVCDISLLAFALKTGKIAGLGIDVFPYEPVSNQEIFQSELRGLPNVILTPHIGGSTEEAQENIGRFVPSKIIEYINTGATYGSVNFPNLQLPAIKNVHRLIHIHKNQPGVLADLNNILSENKVNILGQYLKTNEQIGYVISDIDKAYSKNLTSKLKSIKHTLRFRVLY